MSEKYSAGRNGILIIDGMMEVVMFKSLKVKNLLLGSCVIITFLMVVLILFENNYLQKIYDNSNLFFVNQSSTSELDELRDELDNMRTLNFALIGNYSMDKSVRQIEGDLEKAGHKNF